MADCQVCRTVGLTQCALKTSGTRCKRVTNFEPPVLQAIFQKFNYSHDGQQNKFLLDHHDEIKNARDFASVMAQYEKIKDPNVTIYNSATFAVCSEYLGNLTREERAFSRTRNGQWNIQNGELVSVRTILRAIKNKAI